MATPPGQYMDVNGVKIHYEKLGNGPHVVLLLPGGLGSTRTDFDPQLNLMDKNKYTIVAWDAPGYGYSRPPDREYALGGQIYFQDAELVTTLMANLGFKSFSVMGWSAGGKTGLCLAILYPSKVDKLVIWGTSAVVTKRQKQILEAGENISYWDATKRGRFEAVYGDQTQEIWSKHVKFCQSLANICKDQISGVRCPTLILYGDKDFVEVDEVKYLIKNISDTQTYHFPQGKHDMHLGFTEEFNNVVDKFLRE